MPLENMEFKTHQGYGRMTCSLGCTSISDTYQSIQQVTNDPPRQTHVMRVISCWW